MSSRFAILTILCVLVARSGLAQDRPFVFSLTTAPDTSKSQVLVDYAVGVGEHTFHTDAENGPEQRVGLQASLGRWTVLGQFGVATAAGNYQTSQQGELLYSFLTQGTHGITLSAGGGLLHEADGVDVVLGRVVAGRDYEAWRLHGNLVFQRALAPNRDALDLITTIGWARRVSDAVSMGVEGIGEDLEGFWDPTEAEGGARILIGPSIHIGPRGRAWQLSAAGGPTLHPSDTGRSSGAVRDLPPTNRPNGYALRVTFACNF
jgi:hypothetical protein